jgi:hypothetical protein
MFNDDTRENDERVRTRETAKDRFLSFEKDY